jgi:hypothetical protein
MADPSVFNLTTRPTCPSILIPFEQSLYALPIQQLHITAEFNVSTAFVKIQGVWKNIANYSVLLVAGLLFRAPSSLPLSLSLDMI